MTIRSGKTHIFYDHKNYPTAIDIKCPKCHTGKATSRVLNQHKAPLDQTYFSTEYMNVGPLYWSIACDFCTYRHVALLNFSDPFVQLSEFYYKLEIYNFYAFNQQHLIDLVSYFKTGNSRGLKYQLLIDAYCHGAWKKHKVKILKKINKQEWF